MRYCLNAYVVLPKLFQQLEPLEKLRDLLFVETERLESMGLIVKEEV
jgi:hypothetical protein